MKVFTNLPAALGDVYRPYLQLHGNKEWLRYENDRFTFRDIERIMDDAAAGLATQFNVQQGDRVGIAMRNLPEFMISFLAITSMGCVAVPLNALWKTEELEYAVKDSGCKVLFVDSDRKQRCMPFAESMGVSMILCRGEEQDHATWAGLVDSGKGKPRCSVKSVKADDDAMIMYTSGSTGTPKGVCHTQRSVGHALMIGDLASYMVPEPNPVSLMAVPLFHITALGPVFIGSIATGAKIILMRKWDAGVALDLIHQEKVTRFIGVPTMSRDMLEHASFTPEKIATMKLMATGGAPTPPSQVGKMRSKAKSIKPVTGYGLTETMAMGTTNAGVDYLKHPGSCGKPLPIFMELVIKDPATGKIMPEGERGEVCLKGPLNMRCYYNRPEDTTKAIDEEGFFHSGDIGKMQGGFCYILDRLKDLIIRGGENIDCSEVEAAIAEVPAVREVSVFGLPDERLGEVIGAAIYLVDGEATADQICKHVAGKLAKFKVPEPGNLFFHTEELPKGPTGKIDKKGMRDHYSEQIKNRLPKSKL